MRTLLMLVLLLCGTAHGAIFQNSFTTNSAGKTPNVLATSTNLIFPLMVLNPDGSGTDRSILYSPYLYLLGSNLFVNGAVVGNGGGGSTTNYYSTIITTNLTVLNNLTVSNITVTNVTVQNNLTVSNLFTVNGNHNTLIVTNALTLQSVKTNVLATTSTGLITNVNYGTGISWDPATLTLSASGGGGSTPLTFNTLTYSGTNVTVDCSLGDTNGAAYKLTLTNTTWFTVPTSVPTTAKGFQIWFQQPSTGLVAVAWSNVWKFPGGVQPIVDTNASAVTVVTFAVDPFTNKLNYIGLTPQLQ